MKITVKKKDGWWHIYPGEDEPNQHQAQLSFPTYSEAYACAIGVGWARTNGTMKGVDIETEVE